MNRCYVFVLLSCGVWGQADSKCTIEVTAINALTKEPVRHAEVQFQKDLPPKPGASITDGTQSEAFITSTDDAGKASGRLEPGLYWVELVQPGFLHFNYGSKRRMTRGTPVACTLGKAQSIQAELTPYSAITGRVLNDEGEPVGYTSVILLEMRYQNGKRQFIPSERGFANDRGEYRIAGVYAGKYKLMTEVRGRPSNPDVRRIPLDASASNQGYVATYYPNTTDESQAAMIVVPVGAELANSDIRARRGAMHRVSGKVVDATQAGGGGDRQGIFLTLMPRAQSGGGFTGSPVRADGQFDFQSVAPGSYFLFAQKSAGAEPYRATVPLDVSADVENITLALQPGFAVTGIVVVQGVDKPDNKTIHVNVASEVMLFGQQHAATKAGGSFTLKPLWPGRYKLNLFHEDQKAYLSSLMWNGRDVSAEELEFTGASSGIEVIFRADSSSVSGAAPAGTVILIPVDGKRVKMGHLRTGPVTNGRFNIQGVPPGEYNAFAMDDMDSHGIWEDPDWFKANESKMKRVTVPANGSVTVDVEIVAGQGS